MNETDITPIPENTPPLQRGSHPQPATERGKVSPQDFNLEEVILGVMLIDRKGVDDIIDILSPEVLYKKQHQLIYQAIFEPFNQPEAIDLLTVAEQLHRTGNLEAAGGKFYLTNLTQRVSSSVNVESHVRIVLQKFTKRKLIEISAKVIEDVYDDICDVFGSLDNTKQILCEITQGNLKRSSEATDDSILKALKKIQELSNKTDGFSGVSSDFTKLGQLTSGWQANDLIITAARPGMSKAVLTLSMARNIAVGQNVPVTFFSLEIPAAQLITHLISSETGLSSERLRTGKLEEHEWSVLNTRVKDLEKALLYMNDTPSISIFDLRAKARRLSTQFDAKLIVIDYLQLMTVGGNEGVGNREREISTISCNLKALARELDTPVIALSQLSRNMEACPGHKRPQLSDLRESGTIEQDVDVVSFIYRLEYYKINEWDNEAQTPTAGQAEFIVAKYRNGGLGSTRLKFEGYSGRFADLGEYGYTPFATQELSPKMNDKVTSELPPTGQPSQIFGIPEPADDTGVPFQRDNQQMKKRQPMQSAPEPGVIYLAGGYFQGTEHFFKQVRKALGVQSGYVNGHTNKPTYKEVVTGEMGYAGATKLTYDPQQLSFKKLLALFFSIIDLTSLDQQGTDVGIHYRAGTYHMNEQQRTAAEHALRKLAARYTQPIVVEYEPFRVFQPTEDWHTDHLTRFPSIDCHIAPEVFANARMANPIKLGGNRHSLKKFYQFANHS